MSIEPEDSLLEQALRGDLPSPDTETRLRRRLLAAGVAIGNGVATTTAAAGTATSASAASGLIAKTLGLSWGIKLGVAAVVAIPTLGLLLEDRGQRRQGTEAALVTPARASNTPAEPLQPPTIAPLPVADTAADLQAAKPASGLAAAKAIKLGAAAETAPGTDDAKPDGAHPSRADFGAAEAPARAPQIPSTLAEETRLLDGAFAALAAGDRARAGQLIEEHAARYPNGLLQKERERAQLRLSEMSRGE